MDVNQFIWIIPLTLLTLIVVQILFILWLRYAPTHSKTPTPRPQPSRTTASNTASVSPPSVETSELVPEPANTPASQRFINKETSAEMINKFVVLSGLQGPKEMRLPSSDFRIGRYYNLENNILVGFDEMSVSRKHAHLTLDYQRQEYYLTDTNSSYGTYLLLEGTTEQLTPRERKRVYNGDVIRFGNVVTVRLVVLGETRASTTKLQ